jgi:hypothetical protein
VESSSPATSTSLSPHIFTLSSFSDGRWRRPHSPSQRGPGPGVACLLLALPGYRRRLGEQPGSPGIPRGAVDSAGRGSATAPLRPAPVTFPSTFSCHAVLEMTPRGREKGPKRRPLELSPLGMGAHQTPPDPAHLPLPRGHSPGRQPRCSEQSSGILLHLLAPSNGRRLQ